LGQCSQDKISKQKAALQKHAVVVKMKQKELQTAKLELGPFCCATNQTGAVTCIHLEQIEGDIEKAKASRGELATSLDKLRIEVASLRENLKKIEVSSTFIANATCLLIYLI
jgi:structural maintenance of chromosome 2